MLLQLLNWSQRIFLGIKDPHTQPVLHSLAKCLVHEVAFVDLDDALILLEQALLSWATFLLHTSNVQTQTPVRKKKACPHHCIAYTSTQCVSQKTDISYGVAQRDLPYG